MKRVWAVIVVLGMLLVAGATDGMAQSKVVLKAGHTSSLIYQHHIGLLKMNEIIKSRTNGQIEIQIFPMSQLGNERDLVEGILTSIGVGRDFLRAGPQVEDIQCVLSGIQADQGGDIAGVFFFDIR